MSSKSLSDFGSFGNYLSIDSNRLCSKFLHVFLQKQSHYLKKKWWHCTFHITNMVSLFPIFIFNIHCRKPRNILVTTASKNIDWHSFNFDQLFSTLLFIRTIYISKLKYLNISVMWSEKNSYNNIFAIHFNQ